MTDSYLRSDGRLLCVLGVTGLAVVDTPDAVLVAPIERAQEVKAIVAELEARGVDEASTPARVHRPWGWYQTMDLGERFRVKRMVVAPGKKLSLQKHHHRAEHWVVVRGTAEVTRDARGAAGARERVDLPALRLRAPARPTRARSRSRSSRCRPAPTSRRTTSSASRTTSAACEPARGRREREVRHQRPARPGRGDDRPGLRGACPARSFRHLRATEAAPGEVLVGRDLRPSSPRIAAACRAGGARGRRDARSTAAWCRRRRWRSRPARRGAPAIMVTGSHIPFDRNGLKFYRPPTARSPRPTRPASLAALAAPRAGEPAARGPGRRPASARATSRARSTSSAPGCLGGLRIGLYAAQRRRPRAHRRDPRRARAPRSSPLGRTDSFVPIDTEAIAARGRGAHPRLGRGAPAGRARLDRRRRRPAARRRRDRRGAARRRARGAGGAALLGADAVATPLNASTALERLGLVRAGPRTRIGSPYVIEGMRALRAEGARLAVGYEANGGFLLGGTAVSPDGRRLAPLPTRDALVPIARAPRRDGAARRRPLSELAGGPADPGDGQRPAAGGRRRGGGPLLAALAAMRGRPHGAPLAARGGASRADRYPRRGADDARLGRDRAPAPLGQRARAALLHRGRDPRARGGAAGRGARARGADARCSVGDCKARWCSPFPA